MTVAPLSERARELLEHYREAESLDAADRARLLAAVERSLAGGIHRRRATGGRFRSSGPGNGGEGNRDRRSQGPRRGAARAGAGRVGPALEVRVQCDGSARSGRVGTCSGRQRFDRRPGRRRAHRRGANRRSRAVASPSGDGARPSAAGRCPRRAWWLREAHGGAHAARGPIVRTRDHVRDASPRVSDGASDRRRERGAAGRSGAGSRGRRGNVVDRRSHRGGIAVVRFGQRRRGGPPPRSRVRAAPCGAAVARAHDPRRAGTSISPTAS